MASRNRLSLLGVILVALAAAPGAQQRETPKGAPDRRADEGKGPFKTLAIRGVMVIDGTGAPPTGPVDVIVSGNRITAVQSAGMPGLPVRQNQNPLQNFKVLYGTGALKLNDKTARPEQVGGVKYTIKDGIVYDAKQLLADVATMVERQKRSRVSKTSSQ